MQVGKLYKLLSIVDLWADSQIPAKFCGPLEKNECFIILGIHKEIYFAANYLYYMIFTKGGVFRVYPSQQAIQAIQC